MSAHALHFPERPRVLRWTLAGCAIVLAHAATVAALVAWYQRTPPEQPLTPAIVVSFAPAAPAVAEHADEPVAEQKVEQIEDTPPDPPKVEEPKVEEAKVEQPPEKVAPPPPRPAEIALPKPEPKRVVRSEPKRVVRNEPRPVERTKPPERRLPPQEGRAPAATPAVARQSSVTASNNYASLVVGQLERNKQIPPGAPKGTASLAFTVSRDGNLLGVRVTKSSGNSAIDQTAIDIVRRASPFPHFPAEMNETQHRFFWLFETR
jgi:protein TonB